MRFFSGAIVGALVATSMTFVSLSTAHADDVVLPDVAPVDVQATTVPAVPDAAAASASSGDEIVAALPARRTDEFGLVGVTWDPGFDATGLLVEVRLRSAGAWGGWEELHVETDEGNDQEGGRDGTEPLWVGSADGVSVRVASPTGERPTGLEVATIDPGTTATEASATTASSAFYRSGTSAMRAVVDGSPTYTARPGIISRAAWGAAPNTRCDTPIAGDETKGAVVHHTAGTNSYTQEQSASIVRATQAYHMKARNWCDVGYNFLVDKYGQIFEGRNGGTDRAVRAAHSGNADVNTYTMGVSMMGTFTTTAPSDAMKDAMVRLIGWRVGTTFHPAIGTYAIGGKALNRIAGHRDVVGTECPGAAAYAWLSAPGGLRARVAAYTAAYSTPISARVARLGPANTGPVFVGEYPFTVAGGGSKVRTKRLDIISSRRGTFTLADHVRSRYATLGSENSPLGVPKGSLHITRRSSVKVQRFVYGSIYRVKRQGKTSGYAVWGSIENKYIKLKQADGRLGAPTKTQRAISGGRQRAYFAKGTLTLEKNGRVTVSKR